MSATMNSDDFSHYFSTPVMGLLEPAPVVNVEGQVFKVSQFFADALSPLGKVRKAGSAVQLMSSVILFLLL